LVVLLAVFIGAILGSVLGAVALVAAKPTVFHLVEQQALLPSNRLTDVLPNPSEPSVVQTPLPFQTAGGETETRTETATPITSARATRPPLPQADITPIQSVMLLRGIKHDYEHWNNCGPTTLEMALSYFGRTDAQKEIAEFTKPNPDDRNVRPDELAAYVSRTGLHSMIRVGGTLDRLKLLLSNGIPVIVETALVKQPQGWMGHYRLLIGYDAQQFITMDSFDGPNLKIPFSDLDAAWRTFNRLYLVVYSDKQDARVRTILTDSLDDQTMYAQSAARARSEIESNPADAFAEFNLGMSLNGLKRYAEAAVAFDRAQALGLPWRMLWYQFGPYEAYLQLGRNAQVISLADALLSKTADLEESHYYKGLALRASGRTAEARDEFQAALGYNKNYRDAQRALEALTK
jgi:hypothetical protein